MENEKCPKCQKELRKTIRSEEEKKALNRRLNIIEGQIRGINQMISDDRYCDDVLIQIAAAENALKSLGNTILENHLKTCVARDIKNGDTEILDEVMNLIKKLQ